MSEHDKDTDEYTPLWTNDHLIEAYERKLASEGPIKRWMRYIGDKRRLARLEEVFSQVEDCHPEDVTDDVESGELVPPWIAVPGYPAASMMWKMGGGETISWKFQERFRGLSVSERADFTDAYPEPEGWEGWLDMVSHADR